MTLLQLLCAAGLALGVVILDKFLANPKAYVPGTKMQFGGLASAADRKQLIEFLASGANNNPPPEDPLPD